MSLNEPVVEHSAPEWLWEMGTTTFLTDRKENL